MSGRGPHLPAESVDVSGVAFDDPERGRRRARHLALAALVVAAAGWIAVFFVGVAGSETNGIRASWFAIFPTGFGIAGYVAREFAPLRGANTPYIHRPKADEFGLSGRAILGRALIAGVLSSVGLWVFFQGIWPAL